MKRMLIASTSTLHGGAYLEYLEPEIKKLFASAREVVFIPFARPGGITHDEYTNKAREAFSKINIAIKGLHEFPDPKSALKNSAGIFTGGGNTFLLVKQLYQYDLMDVLSDVVASGTPYFGSSAGSNITGMTMQTTNDMPIVYPPDFRTLGLIPFNLNPHYLDADLQSKHMGETRETRIKEFHAFNKVPVIGLREGSWLEVNGDSIVLGGELSARLFRQKKDAEEIATGSDFGSLVAR